jgi:patatin-like phospholipase/acyl hydrolase
LIAAAAAAGVPATRILQIYTHRAGEIFAPAKPLCDVKRLTDGYMYDPGNIRNVLLNEFGEASKWVLNDCPVRVLLTAKGVNTHPWYFVQDRPQNQGLTGKLSLVDCAVASASAPTYFKPFTVDIAGAATVLVDGSVGIAGNPVYQACVEAFYYDDFQPSDTRVVSLGTGYFPPGNKVPVGLLGWLQWTVSALMDAPEDQQTEIVNRHFPGILQRFDWQLPEPIDLADIACIPKLVAFANQISSGMNWKAILG